MSTTHELKIWPEFYEAIIDGTKTFDLRNNDRGFAVGDKLLLQEWDPDAKCYTGGAITRQVSYILGHRPDAGCAATFGLREGYVILGITSTQKAGDAG